MGSLYYGASRLRIEIDDVLLAHLQIVMLAKLRRGESFSLGWHDPGAGRNILWISPSSELHFIYLGARMAKPQHELLESLAMEANTSGGIVIDDAVLRSHPDVPRA